MPEPLDPEEQRARERLGQVIGGKWRLDSLLGVGGMAAVYAAESPAGEKAAIKVLHPEMSRRKDLRHRFMQEGTAATRVGHPGAVSVLEHAEEPDGTAYLVLELLQGESLSALVRRPGGLPKAKLLQVLDEVLDVLAAAHARGIIHRDLKPDNLFVTTDGHIKVLDFGIARVLDDVPGAYKTRTGMTLGTMPYMSPEQALGKRGQLDGRADLFSLGAMTFRILAGRNVHQADTDAELLVAMASKPAPPLASVASHVDPDLCAVVDLALAFSRDSRYPDAVTMQRDVQALIAGKAPPHATRVRQARDSATRTDLPAPQVAFAAGAPVTSRVPAASGGDAATIVDQPLTAPPPSSRVPSASRGAPAAPTRVDPPPEAAPPSSLRAMVMPVVDPSDLAPTIQLPARELPPPPSRPIEPTLASAPATPKSHAPLVWAAILVAALAVIGVSAYLLLAPSQPAELPRPPSGRSETAGPQDPTTKVAAASLSPAGTPTAAQAAAPASPPTAAPAPAARTRGKSRRH